MWKPGTLLRVKLGRLAESRFAGVFVEQAKPQFAIVISVTETGYGTKGIKWNALALADARLITLINAWKREGWFQVCQE